MAKTNDVDVVVLGSGPGGYAAAFRAADCGLNVVMVERYASIGGVCLNVGCIPSKALLHAAKVMAEAEDMSAFGIEFAKPTLNIAKLKAWKDKIVGNLTGGLAMLAKQRKVKIITGVGSFKDAHTMQVKSDAGSEDISFKHAVIACGSTPVKLPFMPDDPRIVDSTGALQLEKTDGDMLILGGGIIGLEMATVYSALGSSIDVVEMQNQLMPGADVDLVKPYHKKLMKQYRSIMLQTKVVNCEAKKDGLWVSFEGDNAPKEPQRYDRILVSVGRVPNGKLIGAENAGVKVDERGFIAVDDCMRTSVPHIYAIGDVIGQPMLAHKATAEGRLAAEVIAGGKHRFDATCIPSVAYTDPEIAWVGLTETQAAAEGIAFEKGVFPWVASGRALAMNASEGFTKLLFDPETHRVLGGGVIGANAGELVGEIALAVEMGCDAQDIALTIHPHPTLIETVALATEMFEGTATDLIAPKKKKKK